MQNLKNGVIDADGKSDLQIWKDDTITSQKAILQNYLNWCAVNNANIEHDNIYTFCKNIDTIFKTKSIVDEEGDD